MNMFPIKPTVRQPNSNDVILWNYSKNLTNITSYTTPNNTCSTHKKNFVHNTTNNTSSSTRHHDPPRPSASSGFKIIGECDRPTSHGDAQSPQHGVAFFKVIITHSLFYNYLFHAQPISVHADKRYVFKWINVLFYHSLCWINAH